MPTTECVEGSASSGDVCSSELGDLAAIPPSSPSDFTSPLGPCFKGRSILKVMEVDVQYSSNPYKYLHNKTFIVKPANIPGHLEVLMQQKNTENKHVHKITEEDCRHHLYVLAVSTFYIVASG